MATIQHYFDESDAIQDDEPFLEALLEEASAVGRSLLALNSQSFFEFQRRNMVTCEVEEPPKDILYIVMVRQGLNVLP